MTEPSEQTKQEPVCARCGEEESSLMHDVGNGVTIIEIGPDTSNDESHQFVDPQPSASADDGNANDAALYKAASGSGESHPLAALRAFGGWWARHQSTAMIEYIFREVLRRLAGDEAHG